MDFSQLLTSIIDFLIKAGLKALGALAIWIAGRWLIGLAMGMMSRALAGRQIDPTLIRYASSSLTVLLNIALVVAILGYFGVETTTFAALIAAGGVAIGVAWGGLLQNFAAGAFLMVLRPFQVGDFVTVAGITGTVREIGLFLTAIDTPENVRTMVGNGKIFGEAIHNYSVNKYRRVDLVAQLSASADHRAAIDLLRTKVAGIPHVLADPAPMVEILEHRPVGPLLAVRPFTHHDHYWDVYFATNRLIKEAVEEAGFPAPLPTYNIHQV
jgi:small conductance mechanosensitive channel